MRGLLFGFLLVVTLVLGASHASAIIYWVMGPWSAVGIEQNDAAPGPSFETRRCATLLRMR